MKDIKVGVIGAGSWGTALAVLLAKKGTDVTLWSRRKEQAEQMNKSKENFDYLPGVSLPSNLIITSNLSDAVKEMAYIVLAVPSHAVRYMVEELKQYLKKDVIIINTAKGIEESTHLRLSQVIQEVLGDNLEVGIAALSGPTHAEEVGKDIPTTIVSSSISRNVAEKVQDLFMSPNFRVYTNPDLIGVEIAGALKNVIALCTGISDGLGYGDNTKAALMTRGLAEIARLGVALGGKPLTFSGLAGVGDLIVTCTSMHSRNRRAGIELGKGKNLNEAVDSVHMVVEGVRTTKAVYGLAEKMGVEMPITIQAYKVLFNNKNPKEAVVELMLRGKTNEIEELEMADENWL